MPVDTYEPQPEALSVTGWGGECRELPLVVLRVGERDELFRLAAIVPRDAACALMRSRNVGLLLIPHLEFGVMRSERQDARVPHPLDVRQARPDRLGDGSRPQSSVPDAPPVARPVPPISGEGDSASAAPSVMPSNHHTPNGLTGIDSVQDSCAPAADDVLVHQSQMPTAPEPCPRVVAGTI